MDKKKIYITEDDKFLANAYRVKFEKENFDVKMASDGKELLNLLKTALPNIILLDLIMPEMDGFTALEEINKVPAYKNVPIIITSNLSQKEDIDKGMKLGAVDYFVKSNVSLEDIVTRVNKYIK